jgi:hypothetical protein
MLQLSSEESDILTEAELQHLNDCEQCRGLLHAFMSDKSSRGSALSNPGNSN